MAQPSISPSSLHTPYLAGPCQKHCLTQNWFVQAVAAALPARCTLILSGEFNARLGLECHNEHHKCVGTCRPLDTTLQGQELLELLATHSLGVVSTIQNVGPTYHAPAGPHSSRIDFVCLRMHMPTRVTECRTSIKADWAMQLIRSPATLRITAPLLVAPLIRMMRHDKPHPPPWEYDTPSPHSALK